MSKEKLYLEFTKKGIILFLWIITITLNAASINVCLTCEVNTIKNAISIANPYDTIIVEQGDYHEGDIIIDKPLTLIGINFPVIDGDNEYKLITVVADSVWIEGFVIQNVKLSYIEDNAGIRIKRKKYFTIKNNKLYNTFFGIYLENSDNGIVEGNIVIGDAQEEFNSGNAIHLWHCKNIKVFNNHVEKHRDGIYFEFVDSSEIAGNTSENMLRYGLHFMFSNNDNYHDNVFKDNGAGVAVMFSKNIIMTNNTFQDNWGPSSYGLLLKEIYDGELKGNLFLRNTIGINAEGSNRIKIENNTFEHNGWAVKILGACFNNDFKNNNFLYNAFDLAYTGNLNENTFDHNYWSDYAGYDLDKNGIGDVPYRPVKLFSYVVNMVPESIVMIRSLFVQMIDFSEKVSPVFTPDNLRDSEPLMEKIK